MTDDLSKKVINIFNQRRAKSSQKNASKMTEIYEGFHFVKMDKDINGHSFSEENLLEYAKGCHYIVRVMKKMDKKIYLYNYEVPSKRLLEFLSKLEANKLNGEIIEIDKYRPEIIV